MSDDNLPVGSNDQEPRLPAHRAPQQGSLALHTGGTALDLFEEPKRDEDEIDLLAYWQILLKRRWLVLGVLASVVALALLVTLLTPPVYRATATLQIDREAMQVIQVDGIQAPEAANSGDFYQTQYELLRSRALAERVADTLQLAEGSSIAALARHSWFGRLKESLRPQSRKEAETEDNAAKSDALRSAVSLVQQGLTIEPVRNSRLVKVNFDSGNPEFSARVVNA